jgi:hypothetical protein
MSAAKPMFIGHRRANYLAQAGRRHLTPRQRRRLLKKFNQQKGS